MIKRFFNNRVVSNTIILTLFTFLIEMYLRYLLNYSIDFSVIRILLSSTIISLIYSYIFHFFNPIIQKIFNIIYFLLISIVEFVEFGLYNFIGFFMGIGNAEQGTKVTSYILDFLKSMKFKYWIILLPFLIFTIYELFIEPKIIKKGKRVKKLSYTLPQKIYIEVITLLIIVGLSGLYYWTIRDKRFQDELQTESTYSLWLYPENANLAVNNLGVLIYLFSDTKSIILGIDANYVMNIEGTANIINSNTSIDEPVDMQRHIDDTAWKTLDSNTKDSTNKTLNAYFISRDITAKNDKTGIFKGKNLILMLMESTNEIAILNQKDFPTLYKLYHEGISFTNNFSPRNNCSTGNNEFTVLSSLFTINNTCTANMYAKNTYPEAAFNVFDRAGYNTSAYHDYTQQYYQRATYMPRMGANKFYGVTDLGMEYSNVYQEWPSDVVMFKQAQKYYMDNKPFFAYFTGVTTHQTYYQSSEWGDAYMDRWKDTNYSTSLKRYLSKMTVLDKALEELLNELKEKGELDNTVIALFGDHFPYGLTDDQINEYLNANNAGYTVNRNSIQNKNVDRTPMLIYNSQIEPEVVTQYTTIIDLLPTLLNMFDLDYDPRLYLGTDIFSNTHVSRAYFADGSWQDENGYYHAPNSKMTYVDGAKKTYTPQEIKSINVEIVNRQKLSASAIKNNYFKYLGEGLEKYKVTTTSTTLNNADSNENIE